MAGIVHIGAHRGEEVQSYLDNGLCPVLLFEPQPLTWIPIPNVSIKRIALGDRNGTLRMYVPHHLHETRERDTQSASGYAVIAERARGIGWTPRTECQHDILNVPLMRFDAWAVRDGYQASSYSLLVIDVQGMEMEVLVGMGEYLRGFNEAVVECSDPPVYDGGASAKEVIDYLEKFSLFQVTKTLPHGDISFRRKYGNHWFSDFHDLQSIRNIHL